MAIYHLRHGLISRSSGRSAVQSVSYITGTDLHESRRNLKIAYKNRQSHIAFTDTLAPEHAALKFHQVGVWDILESFEDDYAIQRFPHDMVARGKYLGSAQTAQTIVVALPRELEVSVAKELVEEFALTRFVKRGLIVTYAIHDDEGNPHAHLQISRRSIGKDGELSWAKDRDIVARKSILETRKLWTVLSNQYLEREGFTTRISEKSYADLGIALEPTLHRGYIADKLEAKGIKSRIMAENAAIFERNKQRLIADPAIILPELTQNNATFNQITLLKAIQKRVGNDPQLVSQIFESALQSAVWVGEGLDGQGRYTSKTYQQLENQALAMVAQLNNPRSLTVVPIDQVHKVDQDTSYQIPYSYPINHANPNRSPDHPSRTNPDQVSANHLTTDVREILNRNYCYLNDEQRQAVYGLTAEHPLSVLVGRAGSGKTTTLKAVAEFYQQRGYRVIGTSLAALAVDNLANETGIPAKTLHSWIYSWDRYQAAAEKFLAFESVMAEGIVKQWQWYKDLQRFGATKLDKNTVLIVDEAGMVGTRQWHELLTHVQRAGTKLIAVGDDHQFKAIEAGDFFRELKSQAEAKANLFQLQTIRRQSQAWMRQASDQLAELKVDEALSSYEHKDYLHQVKQADLAATIAKVYLEKLKSNPKQKVEGDVERDLEGDVEGDKAILPNGLVLAFTNKQTAQINQAIRDELKSQGLIGEDCITINGQAFAIGDKIVFLKNDTKYQPKLQIFATSGAHTSDQSTHHNQAPTPNSKNDLIKNGTFGTIQAVDVQGNIRVQLADNRYTIINRVALEPAKVAIGQAKPSPLYAYSYNAIAPGYAVTTHKAQGQTLDFTIIAAAKNMDAKGIYVAMTRHRDDVQLFYAREDFSSFKALINHLSRFEHKDLVKDYTIRPEHKAAWQRVQEYCLSGLDAAAVLKTPMAHQQSNDCGVDWHTYRQIKQDQINLAKEILSDFKAHQLYVMQAGLTQNMLAISAGIKPRGLSMGETQAKLTVKCYGETAIAARQQLTRIRKQIKDVRKLKEHPDYPKFAALRQERNILAYQIFKHYPLHREFVGEFSRALGINQKTVIAQSQQYLESSNQDQNIQPTDIAKQQVDTNNASNHHQKNHYHSYHSHYSYIFGLDKTKIKQALNARIKDLAYQFLGKPALAKTMEWRYGNKGSISIHVAGHKQGLYSNFETGESGNALKLIQDQLGCDYKQALQWGIEWLGYDRRAYEHGYTHTHTSTLTHTQNLKPQTLPQQTWTPVFPAPATPVDLKAESQLAYMLKGRQEIARYAYQDADAHILGYVVRLEDQQGHKITPTLTYCRNQQSQGQDHACEQWRWQGFGNDRPLYGLEQLKQKPDAPVLIVEGEKTAEAAKALLPDYAVITWSGGCGAVQKSDWSVLKDRNQITIWPDNDKPGMNAAIKIANILNEQQVPGVIEQAPAVKIVTLPTILPQKWDLADKIPEYLDVKAVLANRWQIQKQAEAVKAETPSYSHLSQTEASPLLPMHKDKIASIVQQHRLDLTFGRLSNTDYHHVDKIFITLKEIYQVAKIKTDEDWLLKRATFMVYDLREFRSLPIAYIERARTCLVAATIFANKDNHTDVSTNHAIHFNAVSVIKTHDQKQKSSEGYLRDENSFKELFGVQPHVPLEVRQSYLPALQAKLFSQIKQLDAYYQQRNLEAASKAKCIDKEFS